MGARKAWKAIVQLAALSPAGLCRPSARRRPASRCLAAVASLLALAALAACLSDLSIVASPQQKTDSPYFGIHLVDDKTGRGVALVELRTVNDIVLHSDSSGWVAFHEPGLMGREVYFAIASPGYEYPKDGFGNRGVRLASTPGTTATVKIKRTNIADASTA